MGILVLVGGSLTLIYKQYRRYEAENRELPYSSTVLPVTYAMSSAMAGTFVSEIGILACFEWLGIDVM